MMAFTLYNYLSGTLKIHDPNTASADLSTLSETVLEE
jgi:hypothetical protein